MNELRALIEKGGVVFVSFDDEILRIVEARALPEIFRDAADHVTRIEFAPGHDPGEQRGRGRLSVRAGDDEIVPAAQEKLLQHFRERGVVKLPVQDRFHLRDCRG